MARLLGVHPDLEDYADLEQRGVKFDEAIRRHTESLDRILAAGKNRKPGSLVGAVISFPIADGQAIYVVAKEKPLSLYWAPIPDHYRVHPALIRGLTLADVKQQVESNDFLFGKRRSR